MASKCLTKRERPLAAALREPDRSGHWQHRVAYAARVQYQTMTVALLAY